MESVTTVIDWSVHIQTILGRTRGSDGLSLRSFVDTEPKVVLVRWVSISVWTWIAEFNR